MPTANISATLLVILLASSTLGLQPEPRNFRKELIDPTILTMCDDAANDEPRIAYVKSDNNLFVAVLEIYQESSITFRKVCQSNIVSQGRHVIKLLTLDDNNLAVLLQESLTELRVYNVDVQDCAWTEVMQLTADVPPSTISFDDSVYFVPYHSGFGVLYSNFNNCKRKLCRVTYDCEDGLKNEAAVLQNISLNKSLGKRGLYQPILHFAPVNRNQLNSGFFMFTEESGVFKLKTLYFNGEVSNSKVVDGEPQLIHRDEQLFGFSADNEQFGYCWIDNTNQTVQCRLYDAGLNLRINQTLTIGYTAKMVLMYKKLYGQEFLILIEDASYKSYYIMVVNNKGERTEPIEIRSQCKPVKIFDPTKGEDYYSYSHCIYGLCWNKLNSNITTEIYCWPYRLFMYA